MRPHSNKIALIRNSRGVYCIDSIMGCASGMANTKDGCYGDCYAARTARRYGYDFAKSVLRDFENEWHKQEILSQISRIKMPFIRLGCSGDPSENWDHTLKILRALSSSNTEFVIITRHWTILTNAQLEEFGAMNMCVNTSVSALDSDSERARSLAQFKRVSRFCKSVLRVVSCDFNLENETGARLANIQAKLFQSEPTIDTVFRPSKNNKFVTDGIVNVKSHFFNGRKQLASKFNARTYMGKCASCHEMCGVNLSNGVPHYPKRPGVARQGFLSI